MIKTLTFLFLIIPITVFSQFSISGSVVNANDSRPIANVSVFLNNATIGDKTAADGTFRLKNVPPGKYDLIVAIVGFSGYLLPVTINNSNIVLPKISIAPQAIALNEVKIKADNDPERKKNLSIFIDEFIGTSAFAKECKIINPELLDLDYNDKTKTLSAKSVDFLIIENKALGYRIKYLLSDFEMSKDERGAGQFFYEGAVLFEEMKATAEQEQQWQQIREEVYANSTTHFLKAAAMNRLEQEGFTVWSFPKNPARPADSVINARIKLFTDAKKHDSLSYWVKMSKMPRLLLSQIPAALTRGELIASTKTKGLYVFTGVTDNLYVLYGRSGKVTPMSLGHLSDKDNTYGTLITFNNPSPAFYSDGTIANTGSLTYAGAWANKRLADLLPQNFQSLKTEAPIDSTFEKKIDTLFKAYNVNHPIEKAYLQYDKPYYAAGDTIYFKSYVTDGSNKLSVLSKILNVELINPYNKIISTQKLKLNEGITSGDFALEDTLKAGNYRLRAYTSLMRENGDANIFEQYLSIANEPSVAPQSKAIKNSNDKKSNVVTNPNLRSTKKKIDIQFFPEGGNFIDGSPAKIAFKAVAANGSAIEVKGTIIDDQGTQVAMFSSQHLGMGLIAFTPRSGKRYTANILYNDSTLKVDLPKAGDDGFAMKVDNADARLIKVTIFAGTQNNSSQVHLVAQSARGITFNITGKIVNHTFTAVIPKNTLDGGITRLTLFSANDEPMNERLIFVRNQGLLNLKAETADTVYQHGEKVSVIVKVTNKNVRPLEAYLSAAVIDETRLPQDEDDENTIFSHLLLTSELRGYVEQPNYYFNSKNDKASTDLDLLMLTQGYRRFEWKKILNDSLTHHTFQPENIARVSGKIKNMAGKPVPYAKVSFLSVGKTFFYLDTAADKDGHFVFEQFPVSDSARYVIQAADKQERQKTDIQLDRIKWPEIGVSMYASDKSVKENTNLSAYYNFNKKFHQQQLNQGLSKQGILLREVLIRENKIKNAVKHSSNLNGPGNANDVITADQIPLGCLVFAKCIANRLHGINFSNSGNFYYGTWATLVLVDGVEIPSSDKSIGGFKTMASSQSDVIEGIGVDNIASIEILRDASLCAAYGVQGAGGVIIITTKTFDDVDPGKIPVKTHYVYYSPVTYAKARQFYSPVYGKESSNASSGDLRTTIYWNPDIVTNGNGTSVLEFYNAGTKGKYRITVEGIDDEGRLGRVVSHFQVE